MPMGQVLTVMFPLIPLLLWHIWHFRGDLNDANPPSFFLLLFTHLNIHSWTHTVLRVFMIHCYFKSYEMHAVLPISYMEGL